MIYIGIDIAKLNHFAAAMNSDGEILREPFEFTNDNVGFQKLLKELSKFPKEDLLIMFFPELQYFFKSDIHGKACYTLLKEASNPDKIEKMHLPRLSNLLSKTSRDHFSKQTAIALKELSSQSISTKNDALSLQILQSINQIELYKSQLEEVEISINGIMNNIDSVIKTIPGIGTINGAMILGEIIQFGIAIFAH